MNYGLIRDDPHSLLNPDKIKIVVNSSSSPVEKFSLEQFNPPVMNQGQTSSCSAFSSCAAVSNLFSQLKGSLITWETSPWFTYWQSRVLEGTTNKDCGSQLRDTFSTLKNKGVAMLDDFNPLSPFVAPPLSLNPHLHIEGYERIVTNNGQIDEIIKVLSVEKLPIVAGLNIYESFESSETAQSGRVSIPDITKEKSVGGHGIMIYGYDVTQRVLFCRNSWGKLWGNNGNFYLPFDYVGNGLLVNDLWTFSAQYW